MSLAAAVEPEEAQGLYGEAKLALGCVIKIHERQGDSEQELAARHGLDDVETADAAL